MTKYTVFSIQMKHDVPTADNIKVSVLHDVTADKYQCFGGRRQGFSKTLVPKGNVITAKVNLKGSIN
jgi:hypothetical protein